MENLGIPNYEKYSIDKQGNVWSDYTNKFIKQQKDKRGYSVVRLYGKNRLVHRLMGFTYLNLPDNMTINHKDGNKENNNLDNLEVLSNADNLRHAYLTGIRSNEFGEKAANAKLSQNEVNLIRENVGIISNVNLGLMFGVSKSTISKIRTGINWRNN